MPFAALRAAQDDGEKHAGASCHPELVEGRLSGSEGLEWWRDPGQYGLIPKSGLRIFIEVSADREARNGPSTFDSKITELVERTPEQSSLFG